MWQRGVLGVTQVLPFFLDILFVGFSPDWELSVGIGLPLSDLELSCNLTGIFMGEKSPAVLGLHSI